jgi:hypothetical protein
MEIVTEPNLRFRAKIVSIFIAVAVKLLSLRNFFGLMAVFAGLTQFPVSRMKLTWDHVHRDTIEQWKKIETVCSPLGNFRNFRALQDRSTFPQLRAPILFVKDLTFIEDANKDFLEGSTKLLNWEKIQMLGKVVHQSLGSLYKSNYELGINTEVQNFLIAQNGLSLEEQEHFSTFNEPSELMLGKSFVTMNEEEKIHRRKSSISDFLKISLTPRRELSNSDSLTSPERDSARSTSSKSTPHSTRKRRVSVSPTPTLKESKEE